MQSFVAIIGSTIACLLAPPGAFHLSTEGKEPPPPRPAKEGAEDAKASEVRVEVEGAVLTYAAREIPRAKRGPRGEIEWIQKAVATLKVDKPIGFRRSRLPPGEYRLRVEAEDGTTHHLVVEPAPREEGDGSEGAREGAGRKKPARRKGEDASFALEKKDGERVDPDQPPADAGPGGGARDGGSGGDPSKGTEGIIMKVPLSVAPCERTGDALSFGLKLASKATRLRIAVRAGTTEARVSLRFGND